MRKAFTLLELVVALGILGVVLAFAGTIFRVSVNSQRLAVANGEIMQKLRVITSQLDADFRGILTTYGGQLSTRADKYTNNNVTTQVNSDSLAFFANGDFQSSQLYNTQKSGQIAIVGNVASVFYGPPDPNSYPSARLPAPQDRLLLRRQTILTPELTDSSLLAGSSWQGEYCCTSLEQWRIKPPYTNAGDWAKRPRIDPNSVTGYLPMYLVKGVDNFTISYLPSGTQWQTGTIPWSRAVNQSSSLIAAPRAFKVEFTLYDSKGLIKGGRTFSHIVLLDR